jgi:uncharacterized membrane protein YdjX (TVP38/TMEM64 family)
MLGAGPWGVLLFLCLFCVGLLIQIPGIVFVTGAVLVYGIWLGLVMAILGGLVAISFSYWIARGIGGDPLASIKSARARRVIESLHARPVRTMAILRVFMQMSPALNVALALSGVRYRDYLLGAAVGMWIPVALMGVTVDFFI